MKKLLLTLLLMTATVANAQYPHHNHRHGGYGWVAPTIIGGVIGYEIARRNQPVIVQQPIVVQQTIPQAPIGYHYENILDANCNCYRLVLVQN
jgi:hypothetical protein